MTRAWLTALFLAALPAAYPQTEQVQEPPEEDVAAQTQKEYVFNPLQAAKEIKVANYYFKKGSYRAALRRFQEALKWDPNSAEAVLRIGDTHTKLGDEKAAREAYSKYLEMQPDSKQAAAIRKKLAQKSDQRL